MAQQNELTIEPMPVLSAFLSIIGMRAYKLKWSITKRQYLCLPYWVWFMDDDVENHIYRKNAFVVELSDK